MQVRHCSAMLWALLLLSNTKLKILTSAGGQVLDVTQNTFGTVTIRGYVPSTDSFLSDETAVELSTKECNLQAACTANTAALNAPMCALYPVDMAYAGDAVGLVTDRYAYMHAVIESRSP